MSDYAKPWSQWTEAEKNTPGVDRARGDAQMAASKAKRERMAEIKAKEAARPRSSAERKTQAGVDAAKRKHPGTFR